MKDLIACLACLFLTGSLMAQGGNKKYGKKPAVVPADTSAIQLVFELSDGSRIIGTPATGRLKIASQYADVEIPLSRMREIEFNNEDSTARIDLQNGDHLNGRLAAKEIEVKAIFGKVAVPLSKVSRIEVDRPGEELVNSLGMKFVPVPGIDALFCIWDTRVKDFRAYAEARTAAGQGWSAGFGGQQGDVHPVVNVTWVDAKAFCAWLTQKERKEGKITQNQEYRLPTDKEWSVAVGKAKYPWGDEWPPPKGAGNYAAGLNTGGFNDTSPVGCFKANPFGLYDMGGNVWQWCEDWYRPGMNNQGALDNGGGNVYRVLRGGCWSDSDPGHLLSAFRNVGNPGTSGPLVGFRCVLAPVSATH